MVSDRHANFFVNKGSASCSEMLKLIDDVRERVRRRTEWISRTKSSCGKIESHERRSVSAGSAGRRGAEVSKAAEAARDQAAQVRQESMEDVRARGGVAGGGVALAGTCYAWGDFLLSSRHMALLQRDQIQIRARTTFPLRPCRRFSAWTAITACCAFRWMNGGGNWKDCLGGARDGDARAAEPRSKWKSGRGRPSHFCAQVVRWRSWMRMA